MNRRGFLGFLGAAASAVVIKPTATIVRFAAPKLGLPTPAWATTIFDDMVVATLRNNAEQIAKVATQHNALMRHLMSKR